MTWDSEWVDRLWDRPVPEIVVGQGVFLTQEEKKILLAYARGGTQAEVAEAIDKPYDVFKTSILGRLQAKLKAKSAPRMIRVAFEQGILMLRYPDAARGPAPVIPDDLLRVLRLVADGLLNPAIAEAEGITVPEVRARIKRLSRSLMVTPGVGGRTQMVAVGFQLGLLSGAQEAPARLVAASQK